MKTSMSNRVLNGMIYKNVNNLELQSMLSSSNLVLYIFAGKNNYPGSMQSIPIDKQLFMKELININSNYNIAITDRSLYIVPIDLYEFILNS